MGKRKEKHSSREILSIFKKSPSSAKLLSTMILRKQVF